MEGLYSLIGLSGFLGLYSLIGLKGLVTFAHLEAYDERRYGKTLLWFFAAREPTTDAAEPQEK